jgi:fructokinase
MRVPHLLARDPFPGSCPYHGDCWEGLAAGSAMQARWGKPGRELADDHPAWALEADYLAAGIANIITVISPERFVVGGGVFQHPGLIELVRERVRGLLGGYLDTEALTTGLEDYLVAPGLGDRAGSLGAVALAAAAAGDLSAARGRSSG